MLFSGKGESIPSSPRTTLAIGLVLLALQLLAFHPLARGQEQNATSDEVKAAYLFNFAKLAEWPAHALPDGPSALVIGVSGGDEKFLAVLKSIVAEKIVGTHPLAVRPVSSEEDMKSCQVVFFRASEGKQRTQAAMEGVAQTGVLLVGEDDYFLRQGGMINLVRDHGSVRFEVNPDALDRSEIHFSSKILALAKASYRASAPVSANSASPVEGARRLERNAPPEYPALAGQMKLKGTVQVQALVKPDGTVREVKILGGHPLLAAAVANAVLHWRYQPAPKETMEVVKFTFGPQ